MFVKTRGEQRGACAGAHSVDEKARGRRRSSRWRRLTQWPSSPRRKSRLGWRHEAVRCLVARRRGRGGTRAASADEAMDDGWIRAKGIGDEWFWPTERGGEGSTRRCRTLHRRPWQQGRAPFVSWQRRKTNGGGREFRGGRRGKQGRGKRRPAATHLLGPVLRLAAAEGRRGAPLFGFGRGKEEESLGQEMARDRVEARGGGFGSGRGGGCRLGWC